MSKALEALAAATGDSQEPATSTQTRSTKAPPAPKSEPKLELKSEKLKALKVVEASLNKQFNTTNAIIRLGSKVGQPLPSVPTGLPTLDLDVLQCGGIPRGRIIEIFGPESSGKTTLALHIIAEEQAAKPENLCAYVDAEHALDASYMKTMKVNVDDLLVSQPDSGEQALETVEALVESKLVSIIVVDSVAALVPQAELDGEMGDSHMGLQARLMSQACRKLRAKAAVNGVTLIFINQIREKIGVMYGNPETTTGGRALKFYSSVRLDVRRPGESQIKTGDVVIGHKMRIKAVKNKVGTPLRETVINLIYGVGIDKEADVIEYAVNCGVIAQAGSWYSFDDQKLGQGLENAKAALKASGELMDRVKERIQQLHESTAQKEDL